MKKEGIQTRKRKPKNLNKSKPGMKMSFYTVSLKTDGVETPHRAQWGVGRGSTILFFFFLHHNFIKIEVIF